MVNKSDEELIVLVRRQNTAALKELYRRYERRIFNFILKYCGRRQLSQDLLQRTFERVWFGAHLFAADKGSFKGWVFTIALNLTRNEMSRKYYRYHHQDLSEVDEQEVSFPSANIHTPETAVIQQERKALIARALGLLKPHLREIIILKHYQQLKFREIAEILDVPEGTLKARFQKAIADLKVLLNAEDF